MSTSSRQTPECLVEDVTDEVAESGVRQMSLCLHRTGTEDAKRPLGGELQCRAPESRLADPGIALDDERRRGWGGAVEELLQRV
jgi:hypothetical protein